MAITTHTPPAQEPVTLAEAKLACAIDTDLTEHDSLLSTLLIPAAREQCEHLLGRALINQVLDCTLDAFPAAGIELPRLPVQGIVAVDYLDADGVQQTVPDTDYVLDVASDVEAWVRPVTAWPQALCSTNAVRVRYTAGYGATGTAVPANIRWWILQRVATLYRYREAIQAGTSIAALPRAYVDGLLDRYRTEWGVG